MRRVKNAIIGFGKAGKTLAAELGKRGETTILIEKDPKMYGGTCINVACIPTKKLAELAKNKPSSVEDALYYKEAIAEKNRLIEALNNANYQKVQDTENVEVIDGIASFLSENELQVQTSNGEIDYYETDRIFINTGSRPNIPDIAGLEIDGEFIHTSETLIQDENLPKELAIIGDGYIALEFASIYNQFGSKVTVISNDTHERFLNTLDDSIASEVLEHLEHSGITFLFEAETTEVLKNGPSIKLTYNQSVDIQTEKVLVATGRSANISLLNLEAAGIILNEDDTIQVNKHLQTNIRNVYALGDVKGGPQHTYISLDDYRVITSKLFGDGSYNLSNRKIVPTTIFINPPLSQVGLTEEIARGRGDNVLIVRLPVAAIPQSKILSNTTGVYKAVVDADTEHILGALLFGEDSHEVINIIATAINAELPYTSLANQIYTHPSMAEALNDLFSTLE